MNTSRARPKRHEHPHYFVLEGHVIRWCIFWC